MNYKRYASDNDSTGGVWRTVGGRRIFIKDGQSLESAMRESGKFKNQKQSYIDFDKRMRANIERVKKEYDDEMAEARRLGREDLEEQAREKKAREIEKYKKLQDENKKDYTFKMNDEEKKKYEEVGKKIDDLTKEIDKKNKEENFDEAIERIDKIKSFDDRKQAISDYVDKTGVGRDVVNDALAEKEYNRHLSEEYDKRFGKKNKEDYKRQIENEYALNFGDSSLNYNDTKNVPFKIKENAVKRLRENEEYELYKQAMENPDSIDAMTENSTDWEKLDKKYSARYQKERDDYETRVYGSNVREADEENKRVFGENFRYSENLWEKRKRELLNDESVEAKRDYENWQKQIEENNAKTGKDVVERVKANKIVDSYEDYVVYQDKDTNANYVTSRENYNNFVNGKSKKIGGYLVLNEKEAREIMAEWTASDKYPYEGYVKDMKTNNSKKAEEEKQRILNKMYKSIGYPDEKYNYGLENQKVSGYQQYLRDRYGTDNENIVSAGNKSKERLYQEYKNETTRRVNKERMTPGVRSLEEAYKRAYQGYLKEHPNSKMSFEDFKNMSK